MTPWRLGPQVAGRKRGCCLFRPRFQTPLDDDDRQTLAELFVLLLAVGAGLVFLAAAAGLAVVVFERVSSL